LSKPIYHLANPGDFERLQQQGSFSAESLLTEGFIHCCTSTQLPGVIQRYYIDASSLVLLHINAERLNVELVYENTVGGTELFPHVYGAINAEAIIHSVAIDQTRIAQIAASDEYQP